MNESIDIYKRLLQLFPATVLKNYYNEKGTVADIVDIITDNFDENSIHDFVFNNMCYTKQNIYIYDLDTSFKRETLRDDFPLEIIKEDYSNSEFTFLCLQKNDFDIYLNNPMEVVKLSFIQPINILIKDKKLIVTFTKLEKNIQTYFPIKRYAKKVNVINEEEETLNKIMYYFRRFYDIEPTDFNKGIKYLWEIDKIDCLKIQWRKCYSVATETMDLYDSFKRVYRREYEEIILRPLSKSIWKYMDNDDYLCNIFTADPSYGQISITRYSNTPKQVDNVITEILSNN